MRAQSEWDTKKVVGFLIVIVTAVGLTAYFILNIQIFLPVTPTDDIDFITSASNQYLENMGLTCEEIEISADEAWYMCNGRPYYMSFEGIPTAIQYYEDKELNITDVPRGFGYLENLGSGYVYYKSEQIGNYITLYFYNMNQGVKYNFSISAKEIVSSESYDFLSELQNDFNGIYSSDCTIDAIGLYETCTITVPDFIRTCTPSVPNFNMTCGTKSGMLTMAYLQMFPPFFGSGNLASDLQTSFDFAFPECDFSSIDESERSVTGSCDGFNVIIYYPTEPFPFSYVEFEPTDLTLQETIDYVMSHPKYTFSQQDLSATDFSLSDTEQMYFLSENCTIYQYKPFTLDVIVCGNRIRRMILCASTYC